MCLANHHGITVNDKAEDPAPQVHEPQQFEALKYDGPEGPPPQVHEWMSPESQGQEKENTKEVRMDIQSVGEAYRSTNKFDFEQPNDNDA